MKNKTKQNSNNNNNKHMQWKILQIKSTVQIYQPRSTYSHRKMPSCTSGHLAFRNASPINDWPLHSQSGALPNLPPYANTLPPHLRWLLVHGSVWWTPLCCGAHHQTWLTQSQSVWHLSSSPRVCLVSEQVKTHKKSIEWELSIYQGIHTEHTPPCLTLLP